MNRFAWCCKRGTKTKWSQKVTRWLQGVVRRCWKSSWNEGSGFANRGLLVKPTFDSMRYELIPLRSNAVTLSKQIESQIEFCLKCMHQLRKWSYYPSTGIQVRAARDRAWIGKARTTIQNWGRAEGHDRSQHWKWTICCKFSLDSNTPLLFSFSFRAPIHFHQSEFDWWR